MKASQMTINELKRAHSLLLEATVLVGKLAEVGDFYGDGSDGEVEALLNIEKECSKHSSRISQTILRLTPFKN